jgi:hypothetical protein
MQYYPLVHTSFWLEYHLWQLDPFGYHLVNVLLQAVNAILLWRVLEKLQVRGAWLAAAIFAIHPVHVESVAWISERKNLLCGAFYLSSLLAYLRFRPLGTVPRGSAERQAGETPAPLRNQPVENRLGRWYWLALALFVGAMLSKTVACTLPVTILVVTWWKRGSIKQRDLGLVTPFLAVGAALGFVTVWVEIYRTGASGAGWSFTSFDRVLIAGRALWFYAAKLLWPENLTFIYPRWTIDAGDWRQWMFPLGAALVALALWAMHRRIGRGPIAAAAFFIITLGPALGFFNVYPMRYTFVADHYQYLASIGLIVAVVAAGARMFQERALRMTVSLAVLGLLSAARGDRVMRTKVRRHYGGPRWPGIPIAGWPTTISGSSWPNTVTLPAPVPNTRKRCGSIRLPTNRTPISATFSCSSRQPPMLWPSIGKPCGLNRDTSTGGTIWQWPWDGWVGPMRPSPNIKSWSS